jgi:hypothetical protein
LAAVGRTIESKLTASAVVLALVAVLSLWLADGARAAHVLFFGRGGHVTVRSDPYVPADVVAPATRATNRRHRKHRAASSPTVPQVLQTLYQQGQIDYNTYSTDLRIWNKGVAAESWFTGTASVEMGAVLANAQQFAATGAMTPSRLDEIFTTLWRNRVWWAGGVIPADGQRIEFSGSQIVWEYYQGQGLELQVLGTFGKADGLYTAGPSQYSNMLSLVNEMLPMAAMRNGALTWEYLFQFENGQPPWTSAMSQGTAIEALTRANLASKSLGNLAAAANYLQTAHQALAILQQAPPEGVAVAASHGTRYLLYSFNPNELVINGFLQALIGLWDYQHNSSDATALAMFRSGSAEAKYELPSYDTGAWSLYEPGQEDSLDYHKLVTGFLHQLCQKTGAQIYCAEAHQFDTYLTTPPALALKTTSAASGASATVSFTLSKISNVTITVANGSQTVFSSTAQFPYGTDSFTVPALAPGIYTVTLSATDLAGNAGTTSGTLSVT